MSEPRKKPGVAFSATVAVVVVLVAYPLSMGPAAWLAWQDWTPQWALMAYGRFYSPILHLAASGPQPIYDLVDRYIRIWPSPDPEFGIASFIVFR